MLELNERNKKTKDFFNEIYNTYDKIHLKKMKTKEQLINKIKDKNSNEILDLGVGTGLELIPLFAKYPNANVTVVDISENMLKEIQKRDFKNSIKIICGNFFEIDYEKNFNTIISSAALHHFTIQEKEVLYRKIYNDLIVGGDFINVDKFANNIEEQEFKIEETIKNPNLYGHIDIQITVENEIKILKNIGFKEIEVEDTDIENYKLIKASK